MSVPAGFPEACVGLRYLVALLRGGKVSYKRLDDLTREDRPARIAANKLRSTWLKEQRDGWLVSQSVGASS